MFDFFSNVIKTLGKVAGMGIEKVGEICNLTFLEEAGRFLQDACSEQISKERSYDIEDASIYSTRRLTQILASFSDGYLQNAEAIEEACIKEVEKCYEGYIQFLEQAAGEGINKAGLKRLKSAKTRIRRTIEGSIRNPLDRKMSLDDAECLKILKMDAGADKQKAMKRFTSRVIQAALENIAEQVRFSLDEQLEDIEDYLTGMQEEQKKGLKALKDQFDLMLSKGKQETSSMEQECLEPVIILEEIRIAEEILRV